MKVFLSWSGTRSKEVASLLSDWLCCVIQAARPWISTRDLDRGSLWFGEINDQLKDTTVGIICLTQENKNRPWILFEAGALAKGLSTSRVCTLLVDLEPKDIEDPLAQFNHTQPTKESVFGLVRTLNSSLGSAGLDLRVLDQVFTTYWPQFEEKFNNVLASTESAHPSKPRPKEDVLGEILENTRMLSSRIRKLEFETERARLSPDRLDSELHFRADSDRSIAFLSREVEELIKSGMPLPVAMEELQRRGLSKAAINRFMRNYSHGRVEPRSE
jgi:hypothetical protein